MIENERNPFINDEINLHEELKKKLVEIKSGKPVEINDYGKGKRAVKKVLKGIIVDNFELRESKVDGSLWVKLSSNINSATLKSRILKQIISATPYVFFKLDVPKDKVPYCRIQISAISKELGIKITTRLSKENKNLVVKLSNGSKNAYTVLKELNKEDK